MPALLRMAAVTAGAALLASAQLACLSKPDAPGQGTDGSDHDGGSGGDGGGDGDGGIGEDTGLSSQPRLRATHIFNLEPGPGPLEGTLSTVGGAVLFFLSGTGQTMVAGPVGLELTVDGQLVGLCTRQTDQTNLSHVCASRALLVEDLASGKHVIKVRAASGAAIGAEDVVNLTAIEIPSSDTHFMSLFDNQSTAVSRTLAVESGKHLLLTSATVSRDEGAASPLQVAWKSDLEVVSTSSFFASLTDHRWALSGAHLMDLDHGDFGIELTVNAAELDPSTDVANAALLRLPEGMQATQFLADQIYVGVEGTQAENWRAGFNSYGGQLVVYAAATGKAVTGRAPGMMVRLDGEQVGSMGMTIGNLASGTHVGFPPNVLVLDGVAAAHHTLEILPFMGVERDNWDFADLVVFELDASAAAP